MSNYKILTYEKQKYLYDAYDNELRQISNELCDLIHKGIKNKRYFNLITSYGIRDVLEEKYLNIESPMTEQSNRWKIENRQKHLVLSLTEKCNMRCEYCGYRDKYKEDYKPTTMSDEIMKKAIQQLFKHSLKSEDVYISFYGGEPLIEQGKIRYAVKICRENHFGQKVNFCITTNGLSLNESFIDFLVENKFLLVISLDGPQSIHDRYRKSASDKNTFHTIIKNIKLIKRKYPAFYAENVMFNAVMAPPYYSDVLTDFFEFSKVNMMELKITDYFKKFISEFDSSQCAKDSEEERPMYDIMLTIKELKKFHIISKDQTHKMKEPCGYCLPFSKRVFVNSSGNILVCEKVDESCDSYSIGNVDNWIDYSKLDNLLKLSTKKVEKNCLSCWAIRFCNTCFIDEKEMNNRGEYCDEIRKKVEREYEKYIELIQSQPELVSLFNKFSIE